MGRQPGKELVEACAMASHEMNRAYCLALGDGSQVHWEDAPDWQRESARKGVVAALAGATPEQLHRGWMALKREEGWKYGPVKDPEKREHPCMVEYHALPPEQRAKDTLFRAAVLAAAAALGWRLYPTSDDVRRGDR